MSFAVASIFDLMPKSALMLMSVACALGFCGSASYAESCADLTDTYICDRYCPSEGAGAYKVVQVEKDLQISGATASFKAYISGEKTIIAAWIWKENPLKGTRSSDCSAINWANGSIRTGKR